MRPDNPYAAPTETKDTPSDLDHCETVTFGGIPCASDCWMIFRPGNFLRHLRSLGAEYWFSGMLLVIGTAVMVDHWIHGNRVWPFFFFGLAVLAQLFWIWAWQWSRVYRRVRQDSRRRYFHEGVRFQGFLDEQGIVASSNRGTSRSPWSTLTLVAADPDRIELQFSSFDHRWRLPSRFFTCVDQYHDARRIAVHHLYSSELELDKGILATLPYSGEECLSREQIEMARQWDADHWPFHQGGQRVSFEYAPSLEPKSRLAELRTWILHWMMTVFPLLLSIPVWLMADRFHFGNWKFLSDHVMENLLYIVPTVIALCYFVVRLRSEYQQYLELILDPVHLVVSETGYFMQQGEYLYWSQWSHNFEVIVTATTIGWKDDQDGNDRSCVWDREQLGAGTASELEAVLQQVSKEHARNPKPMDDSLQRHPHAWSHPAQAS